MAKQFLYEKIINKIFQTHYKKGITEFEFDRDEFSKFAKHLKVSIPKNLGDVLYSFRFRRPLPKEITKTAPKGKSWIISLSGHGKYKFILSSYSRIVPRTNMAAIKIPDATPEIVKFYSMSDEQGLLARLRYNRLIDIFLGITTYSLQNHLRTTVKGMGQIEIDEIYVGLNKTGHQFIIPLQAKGGTDQLGIVQTQQDILCCKEKYPALICRPISAQFMDDNKIALFELGESNGEVSIIDEKHYELVPANDLKDIDHNLSGRTR